MSCKECETLKSRLSQVKDKYKAILKKLKNKEKRSENLKNGCYCGIVYVTYCDEHWGERSAETYVHTSFVGTNYDSVLARCEKYTGVQYDYKIVESEYIRTDKDLD